MTLLLADLFPNSKAEVDDCEVLVGNRHTRKPLGVSSYRLEHEVDRLQAKSKTALETAVRSEMAVAIKEGSV